ncbi:ATP-dependent sacrificial sulfur transferase LarE [Methanosarcina mazei]|uniref:ATP-dependent sacrificial sulfur transferase LarE n=1 Tax=Methanosarcina mazei TaxID=2209 RepID=A0A0F8BDQ6_METMZ|nr:ATP-dependent sacrificial sulfur transferase LarE [Methanosarcina mazei]KKG00901.1 asparagine synthase [Methanosarcina mazei]KKG01292.1 asparagine synthase [Methanosarcina mazei]KKG04077.1 asparagine synthase [Methanosarcina mazei]KKG29661.1 asparagine synthase [Methanosarcina mazei]KKG34488.1 asparagine synthase [Methanosarcina mazei]
MDIARIEKIREAIKARESVVIAFSGGVDSTTLAALAFEELGDRALAVTIDSPLFPRHQLETASQAACEIGIQHKILPFSLNSVPYFTANTINRCYFCKKALIETLLEFAEKTGYNAVLEGTNASEIKGENRPGYRAIQEAGEKIYSPFVEFNVTKEEIREIAANLSLSAAGRPSAACLATRIAYGQPITPEALEKIEKAEDYLLDLGFTQFRIRLHSNLARIELTQKEIEEAFRKREKISRHLKTLGFDYVTLDLEGFRSGSMDEPYLQKKSEEK